MPKRNQNKSYCKWNEIDVHCVPDGECYLQEIIDDNDFKLIHVFKDIQYSIDPDTGISMYNKYNESFINEEINMNNYKLNKRLCSVTSEINANDEQHIMNIVPVSAEQFWLIVETIFEKWIAFYKFTDKRFWPNKSTALDIIYNVENNEMRYLRPIRFSENSDSFARGLILLIKHLITNYFLKELETLNNDYTYLENLSNELGTSKLRLFECKYSINVAGFYEKYYPEKYKAMVESRHEVDYNCSVKHLFDEIATKDDSVLKNISSKKLFQNVIVKLFGSHRDHIHFILCRQYLLDEKNHASSWFTLLNSFIKHRLIGDEENRIQFSITIRDFRRLYPSLVETIANRKRDNSIIKRQYDELEGFKSAGNSKKPK